MFSSLPRRETASIISLLVLLFSCGGGKPSVEVDWLSGVAHLNQLGGSPVKFYVPDGGNREPLTAFKQYIEIAVKNISGRTADVTGLQAFFYSDPGDSVLELLILNQDSSLPPGQTHIFHVDTDSYMEYMGFGGAGEAPMRLLVSFEPGKSYFADLPSRKQLLASKDVPLHWNTTSGLPITTGSRITKMDEFSESPIGVPAIFRKQSGETTLYFLYRLPTNSKVALSTKQSDSAFIRTGDIWHDLAPLGITRDTPLKEETYSPR